MLADCGAVPRVVLEIGDGVDVLGLSGGGGGDGGGERCAPRSLRANEFPKGVNSSGTIHQCVTSSTHWAAGQPRYTTVSPHLKWASRHGVRSGMHHGMNTRHCASTDILHGAHASPADSPVRDEQHALNSGLVVQG